VQAQAQPRLVALPGIQAATQPLSVPQPEPAPALAVAGRGRSAAASQVAAHAERFLAQGRLQVSDAQLAALSAPRAVPSGRTEETLFGFSVRELSALDAAARIRAAERLKSLKTPAAAPALAAAIHVETDPEVHVALLSAFAAVAQSEGAAIVLPL